MAKMTIKASSENVARCWFENQGHKVRAIYPRQNGFFAVYFDRGTFKPETFDPADIPSVAAARHYRRKKQKGIF